MRESGPRPQYYTRPKRFGSRGPSEDFVSRPFVSDTSPKWIDRKGLGKRRTGTMRGLWKGSCIRGPLRLRFPALTSLFWLCEWQEWRWFFDPQLIRLLGIWKRIKMLHKISFGPKGCFSGPRGSFDHNDTVILLVSKLSVTDFYKFCRLRSMARYIQTSEAHSPTIFVTFSILG